MTAPLPIELSGGMSLDMDRQGCLRATESKKILCKVVGPGLTCISNSAYWAKALSCEK